MTGEEDRETGVNDDETHHHGQFHEDDGNNMKRMATTWRVTPKCPLAEVMATSAWRSQWNLEKLLENSLECRVEYQTHTTSWDSPLCNT